MKKIPTIFERDWDGDRSRVLDKPHADCAWVFNGDGVPTRKLDGTCCLVKDGKLYKRREIKGRDRMPLKELIAQAPTGFDVADHDPTTGKLIGWVPVGDGPEDQYHREALVSVVELLHMTPYGNPPTDGTYELIGPKVQGGTEKDLWSDFGLHLLVAHGDGALIIFEPFDRTFSGIRAFLEGKDIEGIVFHHPDGRMAKIKGRDFGLMRPTP